MHGAHIGLRRILQKRRSAHAIVNEDEAEIVKRIFAEYLRGKGAFTIAKDLNASGFPTVAGGIWQESTILNMLKNEKYKGDAILQKYYTPDHLKKGTVRNNGELDSFYIENNHPAIISEAQWEEVQKELQVRAASKSCGQRERWR